MDSVINGEISEEPGEKEKVNNLSSEQNNLSSEENCDNVSKLKDKQNPNHDLPSDNAVSSEKAISNDTSDQEHIPQENNSSDNLVKSDMLENDIKTNCTSSFKENSNSSNALSAETCSEKNSTSSNFESEGKSSTEISSDKSLEATLEHPEKLEKAESEDEPQNVSNNNDSLHKTVESVDVSNKSNECQESLTEVDDICQPPDDTIDTETPLPQLEVPPKDKIDSFDKANPNSDSDSCEILVEDKSDKMSDSAITPSTAVDTVENHNKQIDPESKSNFSEDSQGNTINCSSNPLDQMNQHLKPLDSTESMETDAAISVKGAQEDSSSDKSESSKASQKDGSADRMKETDSFVFTEISKEETGFPDPFTGVVVIGKYISVKGDFTLRSSEALVESPSLIAPYLLKEPDSFPARLDNSKYEQRDFFHSTAGELLIGIGLSRVSEWYHRDMSRIKKRLIKKEGKSPQLEENLKLHETFYNESRKANKTYSFPLKTCDKCGFATESSIVMEGHMLVPHVNFRREYQCNFCDAINRDPKGILEHMFRIHGKTGRIQPPVLFFECPYCTFESNSKVKLGNHLPKCQRFFDPNRNQAPPKDFEFPALTPKPITVAVVKAYEKSLQSMQRGRGRPKKIDSIADQLNMNHYATSMNHPPLLPNTVPQAPPYRSNSTPTLTESLSSMPNQMLPPPIQMPNMNLRPTHSNMGQLRPGLPSQMHLTSANRFFQVVNSTAQLMPMLGNNPLVTASSQFPYSPNLVSTNSMSKKAHTTPSFFNSFFTGGLRQQNSPKSVPEVTITPLPKLQGPYPVPVSKPSSTPSNSASPSLSSSSTSQSNNLVVCEICDGYIKDLEQLRSHMQLIHKVKIHPKMLVSRPPLNCQKCQWRFFTDQGLERHLLGSHGLVTSNMQELANKSKDAGCCTICGRVYASKLVTHMNQIHKLTLKPAHLSYKCTVCSATFNLYRLFENHVYLVHSGAAKRPADGGSNTSKKFKSGDNGDLHFDGEPKNHAEKMLPSDTSAKCTECGCDFRKHAAQTDKCEKCLRYDVSHGNISSKMS